MAEIDDNSRLSALTKEADELREKVELDSSKRLVLNYLDKIDIDGIRKLAAYVKRQIANNGADGVDARRDAYVQVLNELGIVRGRGKLKRDVQDKINKRMAELGFPS